VARQPKSNPQKKKKKKKEKERKKKFKRKFFIVLAIATVEVQNHRVNIVSKNLPHIIS
jgi:hypothetical protein